MTVGVVPGKALPPHRAACVQLTDDRVASRLFGEDATLWGAEAHAEAERRIGWVDFAGRAETTIAEIDALRIELRASGIDRVVLCGMGGSSLAPEVIAQWAGVPLTVLDSTHPARVRRAVECDLRRTVVVVSSKSGSTIDTLSHKAAFEHAFLAEGLDIARHIVVVTDPGTALEQEATELGQRVFHADPRVGGRYSSLTAFGLVPAGLAGADVRRLVAEASDARDLLARDSPENPSFRLAAILANALPEQYILAVHPARETDWGLGAWVEQLIAESTGKIGRGMLPIALDRDAPELRAEGPETVIGVSIGATASNTGPAADGFEVTGSLGAQLLLWEAATAILGRLLGVNPFDQPDVESAKQAARKILGASAATVRVTTALTDAAGVDLLDAPAPHTVTSVVGVLDALRELTTEGRFLSVQAYLDEEAGFAMSLVQLRDRLANELKVPVSLDWGPRFLHSTGQLHKGGPPRGVFLQVLDHAEPEMAIAGADSGFGALITAQAQGDREVLAARGLPVIALRAQDPRTLITALCRAM